MPERTFRAVKPGVGLGAYDVGDTVAVRAGEDWGGALEMVDHPGTWLYVDNLVRAGDLEELSGG